MLVDDGEVRREQAGGLAGTQAPVRGQGGPRPPGFGGQGFPGQQPAVGHRLGRGREDRPLPETGAQDERVRPWPSPPGGQVRVHQGDQGAEAAAPGLIAEHREGYVGDVHRRDRAPAGRGEQHGAGWAAGQVGHGAVRQPQRQRPDRQRVRGEQWRAAFGVPGVPPDPVRMARRDRLVAERADGMIVDTTGRPGLDNYSTECQNGASHGLAGMGVGQWLG